MVGDAKISVIVPTYNTEKYLAKCLNSLIYQTYANLEIIVVNDASTDNSLVVAESFLKKDKRIKIVNLPENQGLFNARLRGYEHATGEYISTVDSDDFIGRDYLRSLLVTAQNTDADIVCSKFIDYNPAKDLKAVWVANHLMEDLCLEGEEIFSEFNKTHFVHSTWWLMWNKLYKKELWDRCYEHLVGVRKNTTYLEDFLYGNIFITNATKYVFSETNAYYYVRRDDSCTASGLDLDTLLTYSVNKAYVVQYVVDYYKKIGRFDEVSESLSYFIDFQKQADLKKIKTRTTSVTVLNECIEKINSLYPAVNNELKIIEYFERTGNADERAERLKELICSRNVNVVSFDIFDTLLLRPFYKPTDLFKLLDRYLEKTKGIHTTYSFSNIRVEAEKNLRIITKSTGGSIEEVTLTQIYRYISDNYGISKAICRSLMDEELRLEQSYSQIRHFTKELYDLAKYAGKTVICVSDTYFEYKFINRLLRKHGLEFDHVFLSSEYGITKRSKKLFKVVLSEINVPPQNILHIGDTWQSDIVSAKELGFLTYFVPKTVECFENLIPPYKRANIVKYIQKEPVGNWVRYKHVMKSYGVRCALALIANKFFDNPFSTFSETSDFNQDAYYLGYFALGMHNYSIATWLFDNIKGENRTIHFVARDGFSVKETYDRMSGNFEGASKSNYIYLSRKSMLPLLVEHPTDILCLDSYFASSNFTPREILGMLRDLLAPLDKTMEKAYHKSGILLDEKLKDRNDYVSFARAVIDISYDQCRVESYRSRMKAYFGLFIKPGDVMFDIGYSGRGQAVLSHLLGFPIDAYYIHTLGDAPYYFAKKYNFKIFTFYSYTPTITGRQRELIQSDTSPSCIGYNLDGEEVLPIFEKQSLSPWATYILDTIHRGSQKFAIDFVTCFDKHLDEIQFSGFDLSFAHEYLMCRIGDKDLKIFEPITFEDNILEGFKDKKLSEIWTADKKYYSLIEQPVAPKIIKSVVVTKPPVPEKTVEPLPKKPEVEYRDLKIDNSSLFKLSVYYLLFDRKKFTQKVRKYFELKNEKGHKRYVPPSMAYPEMKRIEIENKSGTVLYYALSSFQLLCCILHRITINKDRKAILILSKYRSNVATTIEKTGIFGDKIYLWDDKQPVDLFEHANAFVDKFDNTDWKIFKGAFFEYVEKQLPFDIRGFKRYVLSADCESLGLFLMEKGMHYDLFEDSSGIYSRPEITEKNNKTLFTKSKRMLIEKYPAYGKNKNVDHFYINYKAQKEGFVRTKKCVDFNAMDLLSNIGKEDLEKIFQIFNVRKIDCRQGSNYTLLLTQQLAAFKKMSTTEQNFLYRLLVDLFGGDNNLIIKPHPDDTYSDYSKLFPKAQLLDAKMLSEFIPSIMGARFNRAITVTSASILNLAPYIDGMIRFEPLFESTWKSMPVTYSICSLSLKIGYIQKYYLSGIDSSQFVNILRYTDLKTNRFAVDGIEKYRDGPAIIIIYGNNEKYLDKLKNLSSAFVFFVKSEVNHPLVKYQMNINYKVPSEYGVCMPKSEVVDVIVPSGVTLDSRYDYEKQFSHSGLTINVRINQKK